MLEEACRTCLRLIDVGNSPFYELEADDVHLSTKSCRYKLLSFIPEMALNITPKSVICADCLSCLDAMFEFKARCLNTENIITRYVQAKPDVDAKNLDLKDVSAFSTINANVKVEANETSIEYVTVKEEVEASDVEENFAAVVKHVVDDYSSDRGMKSRPKSHTDEGLYKCTICTQGFNDKSTLNKHVKYHSQFKEYRCKVCAKKFVRCDSLKIHLMMHIGVCNYACGQCGRRFDSIALLKKHICSRGMPLRQYILNNLNGLSGKK